MWLNYSYMLDLAVKGGFWIFPDIAHLLIVIFVEGIWSIDLTFFYKNGEAFVFYIFSVILGSWGEKMSVRYVFLIFSFALLLFFIEIFWVAVVFLLLVTEKLSAEKGDPDLFLLRFLIDNLVFFKWVGLSGLRSIYWKESG